jgi:hypothetical protein
MSSPHPTSGQPDRPTPKQLHALRRLALSRGQTFTSPHTKAQASAELRSLIRTPGQHAIDRGIEHDELQRVELPRDATAVGEHEISGHGSSAQWTHNPGERS